MTTLRTLVAAALLPLAACSVSTDDLKPLPAGSCGSGLKECGYKCVSTTDPATGCGDPASCQPCAGGETWCDTTAAVPACRSGPAVCSGTQTQCDGAGPCEDLATDDRNCGVCGHRCEGGGYGCNAGFCDMPAIPAGDSARGIAYGQLDATLYWVDTSAGTGGRLMRWRNDGREFGWGSEDVLAEGATGPDPRGTTGSPGLFHLAANAVHPELYLAGWQDASASGGVQKDFTVFRWNTALASPRLEPVASDDYSVTTTAGSIDGLAAMGSWVALARSDDAQPQLSDGATLWNATTTSLAPPSGMAGYGLFALVGYWGVGGWTLSFLDTTGSEAIVKSGLPAATSRVAAIGAGSTRVVFVWASEQDGSVWLWDSTTPEPVRLHLGGAATRMDVALDASGVYWADRAAGIVWEFRGQDGAIIPLARGLAPNALALDATYVYFTDDSSGSGEVKRVPK